MGMDSIFCRRIPLPRLADKTETPLNQKLKLINLSLSGIAGSCLTLLALCGILVGKSTGASAFLSCILASVIAIFPGMCIVEFATKMPSVGSIYTFTYATIGETMAFLVGWNNLFDIMIQTAVAGKASSVLIDEWTGGAMSNFTASHFSLLIDKSGNETFFPTIFEGRPDFLAALLLLGLSIVLIFAVNISVTVFNVLAAAFLVCFLVIVSSCFEYGNTANFTSTGGTIFSHGFTGVVNGASLIIFAFMLYDTISVSAEEAVDPHVNVPRASVIAHVIITIFLILSCVSIAFLVPNSLIDLKSPFLGGFRHLGINWLVSFTFTISLIALTANGLSNIFSSSRYLYAISRDSLLPSPIAYLHPTFKTPVGALAIVTIITLLMALFFDQVFLARISQFGCVISFFIVGIDLMILRYMPFCAPDAESRNALEFRPVMNRFIEDSDNKSWMKKPVFFVILIITEVFAIFFSVVVFSASVHMYDYLLWAAGFIFICLALGVFVVLCFYQPNHVPLDESGFTVPGLPLVPVVAVTLSLLLATHLPLIAWMRLLIVSSFGLVLYFLHRLWMLMSKRMEGYDTISDSNESSSGKSPPRSRRTQ